MVDSGLLHDSVGRVSGLNFLINGKADSSQRAVPDGMITPAVAFEEASVLLENSDYFFRIPVSHRPCSEILHARCAA